MVGYLDSGTGSLPSPQNNNFKPLYILLSSFFTTVFFSIVMWFYDPGFYKASFSPHVDSYARLASSYVNVQGLETKFYGNFVGFSDKDGWRVYLSQSENQKNIELSLLSGWEARRALPLENEFYHDNSFDAVAVENFFRNRGVVDNNFFDKIKTAKINEDLEVKFLYGKPELNGKWNFTPSTQNGGLVRIDFDVDSTTIGRLYPDITWHISPNFVPDEIANLRYGVRPLSQRLLQLLSPSYLVIVGTLYYLFLGAGSTAFALQIIALFIGALFIIFVSTIGLKNFSQSGVRVLWLLLGVFNVMIFYSSLMLVLAKIFPLPS